jgi:hypothetical protein
MASTTPIDPKNALTPSELVYLNGEHFAKKIFAGNVELLHVDEKVSMGQLGEAMIVAALLASEAVGAIRLEVRDKKALMGLRTVEGLFVDHADSAGIWPSPSLEADIVSSTAGARTGGEGYEVRDLLYDWIARDAVVPWKTVFERANQALTQRGLLEATEKTRLKIFRTTQYSLPESTRDLIATSSVEPVREMIDSCQRERPVLWKNLTNQIDRAIRDRKESDDDFD